MGTPQPVQKRAPDGNNRTTPAGTTAPATRLFPAAEQIDRDGRDGAGHTAACFVAGNTTRPQGGPPSFAHAPEAFGTLAPARLGPARRPQQRGPISQMHRPRTQRRAITA